MVRYDLARGYMFGGACVNRISDSMFHSRSAACKTPYGAVPAGQAVEFSVYPQRAQGALHVTLWIEEDGCQAESHPLHWRGYQGSQDRYTVTYTPPHPGLYWYYFFIFFLIIMRQAGEESGVLFQCGGSFLRAVLFFENCFS
mgnify:CR=1 FL=1